MLLLVTLLVMVVYYLVSQVPMLQVLWPMPPMLYRQITQPIPEQLQLTHNQILQVLEHLQV